jgi:predicted nucleic acid-binding Zn ribbon protein
MAQPKKIGSIVADLVARRGYARVISATTCNEAWVAAAGPQLARFTRVGTVRRGVLEVLVANSTMLQEITFQKVAILNKLIELLPDEKLHDVKFRVGQIQ